VRSPKKEPPAPEPLNPTMCGHDVIDLFGPPDFIINYDTWEFDVDADPPYTLKIRFRDRKVLGAERIDSPPWRGERGRF